jgi:nicotinamidase-related amidase
MLTATEVSLDESALLVVDAQDSFKITSRWQRRNNMAFEANVGALIDAYRAAHLPIFYFLHSDSDPGFEVGGPHYKLMDFIAPRDDEMLIHKNTRNCFTSTGLQPMLLAKRSDDSRSPGSRWNSAAKLRLAWQRISATPWTS